MRGFTVAERTSKIRIVLADEQSLFREAVRIVLEGEPDLEVVAEAHDERQAVAESERTRPDVALIDASLIERGGIRTVELIRQRVPACKMLVLSDAEDPSVLQHALEAGANGYMTKDSALADLIGATRSVERGETLVPPRMLGPLIDRLILRGREQATAIRLIGELTRREHEVLALLASGATNDAIAQALVISPETARTHVQNVLTKLGVHSRLEAAAFVTRNALVQELVEEST
jgi:DNA-binding NarL/FixJ family response regulator